MAAPAVQAPFSTTPRRPSMTGVVAATLALFTTFVVRELHWSGTDLAAQVYRAGLFRDHGWIPWDLGWYGGHSLLAYSTLFPPIARWIGLYGAAAISAAVATWSFATLTRGRFGNAGRVGVTVFALGTVVPVAVGQLPFLLAEAFALLALVAVARHRPVAGMSLAVAAGLTNAVAAIFLAFAVAAVAVAEPARRRVYAGVFVAALAPVGILALLFSTPGRFPFPWYQLLDVMICCAVGIICLNRRDRALRWGLVIYALAAIVAFMIPNPMGGNMGRLATTVGPALAIMIAWTERRLLVAGLAIFLIIWQWSPAFTIATHGVDVSTQASYYQPLIEYLRSQPNVSRVEIPVTTRHWEAAYVARSVPLARGWERQLDTALNPIFYDQGELTAATYETWLYENGVSWVALPDTGLDGAALAEASLIRGGLSYLEPAWNNPHWSVWRVAGSPGIVSGPATLVTMGPDHVRLQSTGGEVTLRVRYTPRWTVSGGNACIGATPDGWTRLVVRAPSVLDIGLTLLPSRSPRC